ncbi:MAG: acyl-ACP--UDP-N-acetylglucosamine O-acyltransferase [Candidatus Neomarinimicrobiota bacterium]
MIHSSALVSPRAQLGNNVSIGAYSSIEAGVRIDDNTRIGNFNTICSGTTIGSQCRIYHNCSIGETPQDMKYAGEKTKTQIGNNVIIRESVTINKGTAAYGLTKIGDDVLLMTGVHIAHDCIVGNNSILANLTTLGGHVTLGDWVSLGGGTLVHQFSKVGDHAFVGGGYRIVKDIPPFILAAGEPLRFGGINKVGLSRRGFSNETRTLIKKVYKIFFMGKDTRSQNLKKIKESITITAEVKKIIDFIDSSDRGLI